MNGRAPDPGRDATGWSSEERVSLLQAANQRLASLDHEECLASLGPIVVPALADWWAVDILEKDGALRRTAVYAGPSRQTVAEELLGRYPPWPDAPNGPFRVVRRGRTETFARLSDPVPIALSADPQHLDRLRRLGLGSGVCVPITWRAQTLGVLTFVRTTGSYRPAHLAMARTLGTRVGQTVAHGLMYKELQNANRAKDEFLAMLGHELRNPIGALSNAVALLRRPDMPSETLPSVQAIVVRQVEHLTRLISDLLDVARLTSGKIVLQLGLADLGIIAERCLSTLRSAGRTDRHDIRLAAETAVVIGDPDRLEQVCDNLLDNAVKYTPPGGRIDVQVGVDRLEAVLRVRDTGVGIAADMLPRLFELFAQGPQGLERRHGGLGLGLAIVRRLVELHGGTIHVTSPGPGHGTEVVVRIPLAEVQAPIETPEGAATPSLHRHRVLVVEDNADARETLRLLLGLGGHEVELAENGVVALELALQTHPEVALIDLGLPGIDGYDVARRIRATLGPNTIRLIALTGYGQQHDRDQASSAGFDAFLVKPVDRETLERAINAGPAAARP